MKKLSISLLLCAALHQQSQACSWYDPDYEYFNLFTQSIIKDKSYLPFLMTYSNRFYNSSPHVHDENIEAWQKFFNNKLNYQDTEYLVTKVSYEDLNQMKKGRSNNSFLTKLGPNFYNAYQEGVDYLLEAKYLEPYMQVKYVSNPDSFFYRETESSMNASHLDYANTMTALTNLYRAAKNPEIKLRYGYQIVRFNHYTLNYQQAVDAFKTYVEPLKLKTAPYYLALDQMAGAQRGLGNGQEANWNFFKVFSFSKSRKESAFVSMKLSDSASYKTILNRAQTPEEKNMAYFLLAYEDYNNPIPTMEKMYDIDPKSEMLKVLAARSINDLERSYLPTYYDSPNAVSQAQSSSNNTNTEAKKSEKKETTEVSFWDKIVKFFKSIFGGSEEGTTERNNTQSDQSYLNNPNRIPFFTNTDTMGTENENVINYIDDFDRFINKTKDQSNDEFWNIALAYIKFLKKDYKESLSILNGIKTDNKEYLEEINKMKALNEIIAQPKIDAAFEDQLMSKYKSYFISSSSKEEKQEEDYYEYATPSTNDFLIDILANRYFLQGEDGKAFLMNNRLSDLQYSPNLELAKKIEAFIKKADKTAFEKQVIEKNVDIKGNVESFFNIIYGDQEMRNANFAKAKDYYTKIKDFGGLNLISFYYYGDETPKIDPKAYNGFENISSLVFGHNVWESFESPEKESMKAENFIAEFSMIKPNMNKLELANALIELQKIGSSKNANAANANQLIGNLMYNSSILGYYRQLFVMDTTNAGWSKYDFWKTDTPYQFYYKGYMGNNYIQPENFDLSIGFYQKALNLTTDKEQKARLLFQMASAEQGKYYQWEAKQANSLAWDDPNYSEKVEAFQNSLAKNKNNNYRTYFSQLKQHYGDTKTFKNLQSSCLYFNYYTTK